MRRLLTALCLVIAPVACLAGKFPIRNGVLETGLNGNGQTISNVVISGVVTNGGVTINGVLVTNGSVIVVSSSGVDDTARAAASNANDIATNALAQIVTETNRALAAEALLYPRSNPSNYITLAEVPATSVDPTARAASSNAQATASAASQAASNAQSTASAALTNTPAAIAAAGILTNGAATITVDGTSYPVTNGANVAITSGSGGGGADAASTNYFRNFANQTNTPTTLAGYGITDAALTTNVPTLSQFVTATNEIRMAQEDADLAYVTATTHIGRTDNPHSVTAAQIGALTNEADTLQTVLNRGATWTNASGVVFARTGPTGTLSASGPGSAIWGQGSSAGKAYATGPGSQIFGAYVSSTASNSGTGSLLLWRAWGAAGSWGVVTSDCSIGIGNMTNAHNRSISVGCNSVGEDTIAAKSGVYHGTEMLITGATASNIALAVVGTATNAAIIDATQRVASVGYLLPASTQGLATVAQVAASTNAMDAGFLASKGGLTNNSFTINGVPVGTGSNVTVAASGGGDVFAASNNTFATVTPITLTNANAAVRWIGAGWTNSLYMDSSGAVFTINGTNVFIRPN
jgi:hypothetical protein